MPSPVPLDGEMGQLHEIHAQRKIIDGLEKLRDRYVQEMKRCRDEEGLLKEYRELMEELEQEKKMHVDELRSINNDLNALESTIKSAESEQSRAVNTARSLAIDMIRFKDQINEIRRNKGEETLPDKIVDAEDFQKLFTNLQIPPIRPQYFPGEHFPLQQGGLYPNHPQPFNFSPNVRPKPIQNPESDASAAGIKSEVNTTRATSSSQDIGTPKQQPAPMKICNSCHQEIHRNAPICPMCKSKSRSKNPKKPKRRTDDQL